MEEEHRIHVVRIGGSKSGVREKGGVMVTPGGWSVVSLAESVGQLAAVMWTSRKFELATRPRWFL